MKELIEKLLKEKRKKKADLIAYLDLTYSGLTYKFKYDSFEHTEILKLEEFFGVEKGYFDKELKMETKHQSSTWDMPGEQYYRRIEQKYIETMEENQILWRAIMSNGIKVDLGKFNVSGLHGVNFFCSY